VPACEDLKRWAYLGEPIIYWTRTERAVFGAFWPLTLPCCLIVYVFLGIINRIY
jgi:hypothetical protein